MPALPLALLLVVLASGCSAVDEGSCVDVPTSCAPLYEPTFENVYAQTLAPKCAVGNGSCHSASGAQGGLALEGIDQAYEGLVGQGLIDVDSPDCGVLVHRIESNDKSYVMPLGAKLSEPERCAIHMWIQGGAKR